MKKERLHQHRADATHFRVVPRLEGKVRNRGIKPRKKPRKRKNGKGKNGRVALPPEKR